MLSPKAVLLRDICYGPKTGRFSKFYGDSLDAETCLLNILSTKGFLSLLDKNDIVDTANILMSSTPIARGQRSQILEILLTYLYDTWPDADDLSDMNQKIMNISDMPVSCVESAVRHDPSCLESYLIDLVKRSALDSDSNDGVWKSELCWPQRASRSRYLFCALTSILNQLLRRLNSKILVLDLIRQFIQCVIEICRKENRDFANLYPSHCRTLVTLMSSDPDTTTGLEGTVVDQIKNLRQTNPNQCLVLLTHYPRWCQFLEKG